MYTYTGNEFIIIKLRNRQTLCKASVVLAGTEGSVLPDPEPEPIGLLMGVVAGLAFGVRAAATTTNGSPPGCGPTSCACPAVVSCAGAACAAVGTAEGLGEVGTAVGDAGMSGECSSVDERDASLAVAVTVAVPVLVLPLAATLCSVIGSSPPPFPPAPAAPPKGALPDDGAVTCCSPAADMLLGAVNDVGDMGNEPPVPTCRRLAGESCGRGLMSESSASDEHIEFSPPEPSLWTRLDKYIQFVLLSSIRKRF